MNLLNILIGAWNGLDSRGRVALVICVTVIILAVILTGVDVAWWSYLLGG